MKEMVEQAIKRRERGKLLSNLNHALNNAKITSKKRKNHRKRLEKRREAKNVA